MGHGARQKGFHPSESPEIVVRACDKCRIKKIRCESTNDGCEQCTKYNTICHFTPIATKRRPRRPAGYGHKQISELEARLQYMETLLQQALQMKESASREKQSSNDEIGHHGRRESQIRSMTEAMNSSMFTPLPMSSWSGGTVQEMPYVSHQPSLSTAHFTATSETGIARGKFSLPTFHELPPKEFALELVTDALGSFNAFFPVFNEPDFLQKFHTEYSGSSPRNPSWWACINVVLALAHRFRSMRNYDTTYETAQACGYVNNALAVVAELNVMHSNLEAVQALVGLAIVLQGTANPHPASVLAAAAIRLAQSMGLHRQVPYDCLPQDQIEQGRRVFWLAYILDKDISLQMRQPFAQDDEDMDAEMSCGNTLQLPSLNGSSPTDPFKTRIGLAVIQGQVYKRLYSVQAARQSEAQRQAVATELNSILSYWKSSVDIDVEDGPMAPLQAPLTTESLHSLILRFTYVNCLVMIDVHMPDKTSSLLDDMLSMQGADLFFERACVIESRKAARLMPLIPHGEYAIVWLLLQSFNNLVETLLKNVERHPGSSEALSDLHLVKPFLMLLDCLAVDDRPCFRSEEAKRMRRSCTELWTRASEAVRSMNMELELEEFLQFS